MPAVNEFTDNGKYQEFKITAGPAPPFVKVTEIAAAQVALTCDPSLALRLLPAKTPSDFVEVEDLIPPQAGPLEESGFSQEGPRGRFRITVEFWPEASA